MRDAMSVLIRPVVSEKSYGLMDNNVYVFIVDPGATKIDVRHAVEQAFHVRVTNVNTLNRKGSRPATGARTYGATAPTPSAPSSPSIPTTPSISSIADHRIALHATSLT